MAFRQVASKTQRFRLAWPEGLAVTPVAEAAAPQIGRFLLRLGHPLRPECDPGTLRGATFYVTRLFDYHRADPNYALALRCGTVVRQACSDQIIGVCLVGGGGADGREFGIYDIQVDPAHRGQGIGTNMIKRALDVLSEYGIAAFHLWREDDAPAAALYERLGFAPTGAVG